MIKSKTEKLKEILVQRTRLGAIISKKKQDTGDPTKNEREIQFLWHIARVLFYLVNSNYFFQIPCAVF